MNHLWAPPLVGIIVLIAGVVALWLLERARPIKGWERDDDDLLR